MSAVARRVAGHIELEFEGKRWFWPGKEQDPESIREQADADREVEYAVALLLEEEVARAKVLKATVAGVLRDLGLLHGAEWGVARLEAGRDAAHILELDVDRLTEGIVAAILPKIATW